MGLRIVETLTFFTILTLVFALHNADCKLQKHFGSFRKYLHLFASRLQIVDCRIASVLHEEFYAFVGLLSHGLQLAFSAFSWVKPRDVNLLWIYSVRPSSLPKASSHLGSHSGV